MNRRNLVLFSVALIAGCRSAEPQSTERAVTLRVPSVERTVAEPASATSSATPAVSGIVTGVRPASTLSQDSGPELPFEKEEPEWEFLLAPYLWAAGLDGIVESGGNVSDVDLEFSDILDDLQFGGSLFFQAHKGRWGLLADGTFLALESEEEVQPGVDADADTDMVLLEVDGFYRLSELESGSALDLLAGVRYLNSELEVTIPGMGTEDGSIGSTMGVLGARGVWCLSPRWEMRFRGDLGLGSGSDTAWNLLGVLGWQVGDHWGLSVGYRWLDLEIEESGTRLDATMQGAMLGLVFGW